MRSILKLVFLALILTSAVHQSLYSSKAVARIAEPEWAVNNTYRIAISVDPGQDKRSQTPVSVGINFEAILKEARIRGRLDRDSIRVVCYEPTSGRALPYQQAVPSYEVPYQLSRDFFYKDLGKIWWRITDESQKHFHIYFDTLENGPKEGPKTLAFIGVGDNSYLNNGLTGPLDVSMSSSVRYLDWDADGKKDLLIGSSQTHEYGVPTDRGYIYLFRNVGTVQEPLFESGYQLRNEAGDYIQTVTGVYMYFDVVDWDVDGDMDLLVANGPKIYLYENTGRRDRNNLPILLPHRQVVELRQGNDHAPRYNYKFPRCVDWDGDGDLDILYGIYLQRVAPGCVNPDTVCYWDEVLQFYELHENLAQKAKGQPIYAAPKAIRTARGLLLNTFNFGGEDYVDWDQDGDLDVLIGDMWNHPAGASRVMFYENAGTRQRPSLLMGVPVVNRIEEIGRGANPLAVDWDEDGDRDLLVASAEGWVKIYKNIGTSSRGLPKLDGGKFVQEIHPKITDGEQTRTVVTDWNGDGLLDLIRGGGNGWVTYYENGGTAVDPVFRFPVRLEAAGEEIRLINGLRDCPQGPSEPHAGYTAPVVTDFDKDGDLDLIVGDMRGYQSYFENIGGRTKPHLAAGRLIEVGNQSRAFGWRNQLAAGDIDGDGNIEVISSGYTDRHIYSYKPDRVQNVPGVLKMSRADPVRLVSGEILLPYHTGSNNNGDYMSKLSDWDNDGDLDLFVGSLYNIWYYENVGTANTPAFRPHGKIQAEGKELVVSGHAGSVEIVDWNLDGQKDLLIGGESGWTYFFERSFLVGNLPKAAIGPIEIRR